MYNPCHIPHCSFALLSQQRFSDEMQKLFAHRQVRDVATERKHQGITPTTQILSYDAFTADTAASRDSAGLHYINFYLLAELFTNMHILGTLYSC